MSPEMVPCDTCGGLTTMLGTRRCGRCWELERRLEDYLRGGGFKARVFVKAALDAALPVRVVR
jgi:hypothetical protein